MTKPLHTYRCILLTAMLFLHFSGTAIAQDTHPLYGTVIAQDTGKGLPGATVLMEGTNQGTVTDEGGQFSLAVKKGSHRITVTYLGYEKISLEVAVPLESPLQVSLISNGLDLEGVEVLSTGYASLPKERATGSFAQVDQKLLNRRVSSNLLDRLEDVTSGLRFNREGPGESISIRGRNTLFANTDPLIVIDNFPYDGPLESINPNDVESITVLRDAAAASIWGARAGNGVIVITTKEGKFESGTKVSFNSNVTVGEQNDLFYLPKMSPAEVVDMEQLLFDQGYYESAATRSSHPALSPAVETLIAERDGLINQEEAAQRLASYRQHDVRNDLAKYYYQSPVNQQYSLQVSGGSKGHRYMLTSGYDRNAENVVANDNERMTLGMKNSWKGTDNKFTAALDAYYSRSKRSTGTAVPEPYAYERLADEGGSPLPVIHGYSSRYIESIQDAGLLDWRFIPLDEIGLLQQKNISSDYRINAQVGYELAKGLRASLLYQYWKNDAVSSDLSTMDTYITRNNINRYTQMAEDGSLSYPIPMGSIYDRTSGTGQSQNGRVQLDYNRKWNGKHHVVAIGGFEIKDRQFDGHSSRYYGYDDEFGTSEPVDYVNRYTNYVTGGTLRIPSGEGHSGTTDRFVSYYANASYTYADRYTFTASARKDASNLFGVETNQRGVPLWSAGGSWTISNEEFYHSGFLPYLKLRTTMGYNGNIDKTLTAFTTATMLSGGYNSLSGLPYAQISSPPNPSLRWEKIQVWNIGLDLATKEDRISGTLEYYIKNGRDLIGDIPRPSSSGFTEFRGNFAATRTQGIDLQLSSMNLNGQLSWQTDWLFSTVKEEVVEYSEEATARNYMAYYGTYPFEGRPLYGVYSYSWAGLDPDTGEARGYLGGEPSTDYAAILAEASPEGITYHGPSRPSVFGALRNTFGYKGLSLSFNISYRMGYYYKRGSVQYDDILSGLQGHGDFTQRWQLPGDELHTDIPALPSSKNRNRDHFYWHSEALVERGDHIRLQDIRLAYMMDKNNIPVLPFSRMEVYTYANNLGILWKAAKDDSLDPDYRTTKPLKSISLGVKIEF